MQYDPSLDFNADGSLRCNLCGRDPCVCGKPTGRPTCLDYELLGRKVTEELAALRFARRMLREAADRGSMDPRVGAAGIGLDRLLSMADRLASGGTVGAEKEENDGA